jgi:hypothetical protein
MRNIILIAVSLLLFGCNNHNELISKWEKINQADSTKSQIEVYKFGEDLLGKRIQLSEDSEKFGLALGDVCWKNLIKKETNIYSGIRIAKRLYNGKTETMTLDFIIEIENKDLISVKALYTDNNLQDGGKTIMYKKIK